LNIQPRLIGLIIILIGLIIVIAGAVIALDAYNTYKPILPQASRLDEAITNTVYELLNLAIKLGFIGVFIYAGGLLLKHGVSVLIESYRVDKGVAKCLERQNTGS